MCPSARLFHVNEVEAVCGPGQPRHNRLSATRRVRVSESKQVWCDIMCSVFLVCLCRSNIPFDCTHTLTHRESSALAIGENIVRGTEVRTGVVCVTHDDVAAAAAMGAHVDLLFHN